MEENESDGLEDEVEEEEGTLPPCPFCGVSDDECEHLLAIIDRNFLDFYGGLLSEASDEIQELIETTIRERKEAGGSFKHCSFGFLNSLIETPWPSMGADDGTDPADPKETEFDRFVFFDVLIEILNSIEEVQSDCSYQNGAPGYSSVLYTFWSINPKATFEQMMRVLRDELA